MSILTSCAHKPKLQTIQPAYPQPVLGPSTEETAEAKAFIQEGLPFNIEIHPEGAIFDSTLAESELIHLKSKFLAPLASVRCADKIEKVVIDASSLEWFQWTCRIHLKDYMNPISITHFAGLYDGKSNEDPDGYMKSREYVLSQLENIADRLQW